MLGLFAGRPGARACRQRLADLAPARGAGLEVLREALAQVARAPSRPRSERAQRALSTSRPRSTE